MYWGINRSEWIQLWSGTVGTLVAAIVGGLVALLVVRLTNKHQTKLSRQDRESAAISGFVAAVEAFEYGLRDGSDPTWEKLTPLREHHLRLVLASKGSSELAQALFRWPFHLVGLGVAHARLKEREPGLSEECLTAVSRAVSTASVALPGWANGRTAKRKEMLGLLAEAEERMIKLDTKAKEWHSNEE